jgi:hypothetical protein
VLWFELILQVHLFFVKKVIASVQRDEFMQAYHPLLHTRQLGQLESVKIVEFASTNSRD